MNISDIDLDRTEGKLLLAAIAIISTESRTDKTPDEILSSIDKLSKEMHRVEE